MTIEIEVQKIIDRCTHDLDSVDILNEYKIGTVRLDIIDKALDDIIIIHKKYKNKAIPKSFFKRMFG